MNYYEQLIAKEQSFTEELQKAFPSLFYQNDAGELLAPSCGIGCPDGWKPLVWALCESIVAYCESPRYEPSKKIHKRFLNWSYRRLFVPIYNRIWRLFDPRSCYPKRNFYMVKQLNEMEQNHPTRVKLRNAWQNFGSWLRPNVYEKVEKPQVKITQAKSKFGGLRFYTDGSDARVYGMISFAEHLSYSICEETGSLGSLCIRGGWLRTLNEETKNALGYSECQKTNQ